MDVPFFYIFDNKKHIAILAKRVYNVTWKIIKIQIRSVYHVSKNDGCPRKTRSR